MKISKFKQSSQKHAKLQAPSFCSFYFLHRLSREAPGFFTAMGHRFNFIKSWNGTQGGSSSLYNSWQVIQVVEGALKVDARIIFGESLVMQILIHGSEVDAVLLCSFVGKVMVFTKL